MLRPALAAALVVCTPTFADEVAPMRTEPQATFSAEAQVFSTRLMPEQNDGLAWVEVTMKVTRCIAGPCVAGQMVKTLASVDMWRSRHGETVGVVRYEWKDKAKVGRTWLLALRLDDADQKERFARESDGAVAAVGTSDAAAVAVR